MEATMREKWTDERLDDLNHRVDEGFREIREEMRALRVEMNARFDAMDKRFDGMDARFDAMQRTMLHAIVAMSAAFLAGFGGLVALIATQL
jgi:hypothetical protein